MAKVTTTDLLKNSTDFLYIFATDGYLKYLSANTRKIIEQKRANQIKYANTTCVNNNVSFDTFTAQLRDRIKDIYGLTPAEILVKLALGYTVAGKNWQEGVFGVGETPHVGFSNSTDVTVDGSTGKIMQNGKEVSGQTPIYSSYGSGKKQKTYISGYSATIDGTQYSSQVSGKTYKTTPVYYSSNYSTSEGAYNWDGSTYSQDSSASVWNNIQSSMPQIQKFIEWLGSLFNIQLISAKNTVPQQSEMVYTDGNSSNVDKILIGGAAAVGFYLLFSDKKKK